ncbi:MAG TPA: hypothetical protein VIX91_26700 [Candidatus Acidoferrum sp.]
MKTNRGAGRAREVLLIEDSPVKSVIDFWLTKVKLPQQRTTEDQPSV